MTVTIVDWAKKLLDPVHTDTACSCAHEPWRETMNLVWVVSNNTASLLPHRPESRMRRVDRTEL